MQLIACNVFRQLLSQIDCERQYNREYLYSYNNVVTIIQAFSNILTQIKRAEYANIANMSLWDHIIFVQKVKSKNNTIAIAITLDTANLQISKYQMTFILTPITQYQHTDNLRSLPPTLLFQANYVQNYSKDYYLFCKEDSISDDVCTSWIYNFIHSGTSWKPFQLGN
uniref:Uncharacterized protein n=1 Tax=Spironucleus salmonicida TaxID=348837 RepID=V6LEF9_9EUKA|eukprot:EST42867.1 Hypothetical protein SS50377_17488 [Spironucleus salmonicida]